jgi:hypothetical protein
VVSTIVEVSAVRAAGAVGIDAGEDGERLSSSHLAAVILLPFCFRWSSEKLRPPWREAALFVLQNYLHW